MNRQKIRLRLGVVGYPLAHSFSPAYFQAKFRRLGLNQWDYQAYPLAEASAIPRLFEEDDRLVGLNVTIPHKPSALTLAATRTSEALTVGAANTLRRERDRSLTAHNTDALALGEVFLERSARPGRALVLGSGGASRAVCVALRRLEIVPQVVSRRPQAEALTYAQVTPDTVRQHPWIINTTPLGMWPDTDSFPPLPYEALTGEHWLLDLVYNPEQTAFMQKGRKQGAAADNGRDMLEYQAEYSWEFWRDVWS
jgi:shikimate dehydrogenase